MRTIWVDPNTIPAMFGARMKRLSTRAEYSTQPKLLSTFTTPMLNGIEDAVLVFNTLTIVAIGDAYSPIVVPIVMLY